jgi:hypothetical protein
MARCECGALYVPSGKNVKITFKQDSLESHMYLEHETDALVLDENILVSYGNTTSQSIIPQSVSISLDGPENLAATGLMKIVIRKGNTKIIEKYFGSKNEEWILPLVNNVSTITASCSDILNNVDIANSKIYVEIVSVCDESPGDCCGESVEISFRNVINTICIETVTTTLPPDYFVWRYSPDGDNCVQDVNGEYLSYQECYDAVRSELDTTVTSTTCDPSDPDCTTTVGPTTTAAPVPSEWTLTHSIQHPFTNPSQSTNFSLHKNGTQIVIADRVSLNAGALAVYKKDSNGCGWTQRGSEIQGATNSYLEYELATDFSGDVFVSRSGEACARFEWDENEEDWSQVSTLNFHFPSGDGVRSIDMTPDGRYVAIADYNYDGPSKSYGTEFAANECGVIEIHEWDGSTWSQVGQTLFGDTNTNMGIDLNLTPDGQTIYFGTRTSRTPQVSKVYTYDGSSWSQKGSTIYPLFIPNTARKMGNDLSITASGMLISGNDGNGPARGNIQTMVWDGASWNTVTQESGEEYLLTPVQQETTTVTSDGRYLFRLLLDNSLNQNANIFEFSRYENMGGGVWGNPLSFGTSQVNTMNYRHVRRWSSEDGHHVAVLSIEDGTNEKRVDIYSDLATCTTTPAPTTPAPTTAPPTTTTTVAPTTTTTTTTTTTIAPPFVPQYDNLFVTGGSFGGCYTRTGTTNGKHSYTLISNLRSYAVWYNGDEWRMSQTAPIQEVGINPPYSNETPFNSLSPPLTGWLDSSNDPAPMSMTYSNC